MLDNQMARASGPDRTPEDPETESSLGSTLPRRTATRRLRTAHRRAAAQPVPSSSAQSDRCAGLDERQGTGSGLCFGGGGGGHQGKPAVRGKGTDGVRPGQRVEEQGTWASRTRKHSEAGYGRPVDRGAWAAKTVKRPRQQPAQPQYANYWAPLTRKRHIPPHSAQPQHTNYWAPRTRKRHQQEHRPQRPTERGDPTQHAKGRTGDRPGPRKGATTRRNVTQGVRATPSPGPWLRARASPTGQSTQ